MAQASFGGFIFDLFRFNPGPRKMFQKKEDIERTGLDGVELKHYGERPSGAEFEATVVLVSEGDDGMAAKIAVLLALESEVHTLTYPGISLENVELVHVTLGPRSMSGQGPVQFATLEMRQVQGAQLGSAAALTASAPDAYKW